LACLACQDGNFKSDIEAQHEREQAEWEALEDSERARYPFESSLKKYIDNLMTDLKLKIKRNEDRLAAVEKPVLLPEDAVRF
jgi:hypothetical protein